MAAQRTNPPRPHSTQTSRPTARETHNSARSAKPQQGGLWDRLRSALAAFPLGEKGDPKTTPATGRHTTGSASRYAPAPVRRHSDKSTILLQRRLLAVLMVLVLFVLFCLIIVALTGKNAYEVYLGDESVGIIAMAKKEIKPEDLENVVTASLSEQNGSAPVKLDQHVKLIPVHASKKKLVKMDYVTSAIAAKVTYTVQAYEFTVDGVSLAYLPSQQAVDELESRFFDQYRQDGLNIVKTEFVEDVKTTAAYVTKDKIITVDKAFEMLDKDTEAEQAYTVAKGDSPWLVANRLDMTLEELMQLNPELYDDPTLRVGQTLKTVQAKPLLSVRTEEEITYPEAVPKTHKEQLNPNQPKSYTKVIQQGSDGQQTVTARVIRINGLEQPDRVIVDTKVTVAPVDEIVEKGTGK